MNLDNFVEIYDDTINLETISSLVKWCETQKFELGTIGDNQKNAKIRNADVLFMFNWMSKSKTKIHWTYFLKNLIWKKMKEYCAKHYTVNSDSVIYEINDVSILKYNTGGHYRIHSDHFATCPRTLSAILLLNNDYKGGDLKFFYPNGKLMKKIDVKPGRLIVWPSTFLYPHMVEPVIEGRRYSIVAWAI